MIELIEDEKRGFYNLVAETRDYLNALMRTGGPDYTFYKLAEKLRTITPRFDWQEGDVERFVKNTGCRFYKSPYFIRGRKENQKPCLTLTEVAAIHTFATTELEPLLKIIRDTKAIIDIPEELTIASGVNELWFSFQTAVAGELAHDRAFDAEAMRVIKALIDKHLALRMGGPPKP